LAKDSARKTEDITRLTAPISGKYLAALDNALETGVDNPAMQPGRIRATDIGFLLNVPIPRIPMLMKAASSADNPDKRVRQTSLPDDNHDNDQGSIRPHLAILVRLLLNQPKYTAMLPPKPSNRFTYQMLGRLVEDLSAEKDWRGRFAPLFGRSKISSYKMLPKDPEMDEFNEDRENSQPVIRLQMLILERFGKIFRDVYQVFWLLHLPEQDRKIKKKMVQNSNWLALTEIDQVTGWMSKSVKKSFNETLVEKCTLWFRDVYCKTLEAEATSRDLDYEKVLSDGKWGNPNLVSKARWDSYPPDKAPILGGDSSILKRFRERLELSSPEMLWLLGLQIKSYFRFRDRPESRLDPSVCLLIRHFFNNQDDLALFITYPPDGLELLETIQSIDPKFERRHIGLLFGGGVVAGYNMTNDQAEPPFFARRLTSIFARHIDDGPEIYWHLRQSVEDEVKARGLSVDKFWRHGNWYKELEANDHTDA
jgi:hypothetical protein